MRWRIVPVDGKSDYSEEERTVAYGIALEAAMKKNIEMIDVDTECINRLGQKWASHFLNNFKALAEEFGPYLNDLIVLADRLDIFSSNYEAALRNNSAKKAHAEKADDLAAAVACNQEALCGNLLARHYHVVVHKPDVLQGLSLSGYPGTGHILEALSLNRLMQASLCISDDQSKALDLLCDSVAAKHLSTQGEMHSEFFVTRKGDRSVFGKKAVSQRIDQRLKPIWEAHCKKAVDSGATIDRLEDLFKIEGCIQDFKKNIDARTLKRWANQSAGIEFKAGRPKK